MIISNIPYQAYIVRTDMGNELHLQLGVATGRYLGLRRATEHEIRIARHEVQTFVRPSLRVNVYGYQPSFKHRVIRDLEQIVIGNYTFKILDASCISAVNPDDAWIEKRKAYWQDKFIEYPQVRIEV